MVNGEFVRVANGEDSDYVEFELPCEDDNTILLTTLQAQFPLAIGLRYRSSTGGWRGIRMSDKALDPPLDGWGDRVYYVAESDVRKRKAEDVYGRKFKISPREDILQDLIVLGLPFSTSEEELKEYFTSACGELAYYEIKLDRETNKSRGFGFIRFKSEEAAMQALNKKHEIGGRLLQIRTSKPNDERSVKLFVGRLREGITQEDLHDHFSEYGDISDLYLPTTPFRGFAFVTFASEFDGQRALRMSHVLQGTRLNVTLAEPKEDKPPRNEKQSLSSSNSFNTQHNKNGAYSTQLPTQSSAENDLKYMLFQYLISQK